MHLTSKSRVGFSTAPIHLKKEPYVTQYLTQRVTFWIAVLSLVAFVSGNMIGQYGWRVFWKSVMGGFDDSLITYTGTVPPIARVPDFERWAMYGGSDQEHTFRMVPSDLLMQLPRYGNGQINSARLIYSVGYMGSYDTGYEGDGSHPAVDIRVPVGTPVVAIANGIVTAVQEDRGGYGIYVVIRHPHMPDPESPRRTTVLYSAYAHLSDTLVKEGEIVRKGQQIAFSGRTGLASGPHLHFQIDREKASDGTPVPFHPYWPFTTSEARNAGLSFNQAVNSEMFQDRGYRFTVSPMAYVEANYPLVMIADARSAAVSSPAPQLSPSELRELRLKVRMARRKLVAFAPEALQKSSSPVPSSAVSSAQAAPVAIAVPAPVPVQTVSSADVADIKIGHPRSYNGREWETITLELVNAEGETVKNSHSDEKIYLRTAYGKAEFQPSVLSFSNFINGKAEVKMLPAGQTTLIIQLQPRGTLSGPIKYVRN